MKEFLEAVEKNEEFKNKILALKDDPKAIQKAVEIAKEYGFEISEEEMIAERNTRFGREVSEDELKAVSGGDTCYCPLVGGGLPGDRDEMSCACAIGGGGEYYDEDGDRQCRCVCVAVGWGDAIY